jgi:hypothetical protein
MTGSEGVGMFRARSRRGEYEKLICWFIREFVRECFFIWKASNRSHILPFWEKCRISTFLMFV